MPNIRSVENEKRHLLIMCDDEDVEIKMYKKNLAYGQLSIYTYRYI